MDLTLSKDGLRRMTMRVEHRIGSAEIAGALFVTGSTWEELTRAQVLKIVRDVAQCGGSDRYQPDCGFNVDWDEDPEDYQPRAAWAVATVRRLWPELDDSALKDFEKTYSGIGVA
jgi:hypothetical protein